MSTLPAFEKDVQGQYYGGAFWDDDDYRIKIVTTDGTGEKFLMTVETSDGTEVSQIEFGAAEADGIARMASTDHGLGGYEDDWTIPMGMGRTLTWTLPMDNDSHTVVVHEDVIDEIADWLEYATGEKTWDGGEVWEF
jgi:hypothetical protein